MRNRLHPLLATAFLLPLATRAQAPLDSIFPVRGFCIDAPRPSGVDSFVRFIWQCFRDVFQRIDSLGD